jgi:hypothetical protein
MQAQRRIDPLRLHVDLPLTGTYYPVGFGLDIVTNSRDALAAAAEAWGPDRAESNCEPIRFRVLVQPEGGLSPVPEHRMAGHLYAVVADAHNFAHLDLQSEFGAFHVSEQTAADHSWLRWFFIESMAYLMLAQRRRVPVHAACVARNGVGILLSGASGAGKSTLSYACARAGWTFVTDDCTWLVPDTEERIAIGRPRQARFRLDAPRLFPELEGYAVRARPNGKIGIEVPLAELPQIRTAPRAAIGGIVFLERPGRAGIERMAPGQATERLLADMPSYGEDVNAMHERTVRKLSGAPAWRMRYETLEDAVRILGTLGI